VKETLKPCPFCGAKPFINVIEPHKHIFAHLLTPIAEYSAGGAFAECTKCTCAISADTRQKVVAAWNNLIEAEGTT